MLRPTQEVKLMFTNVAIASLMPYVHMFQIKTASKKMWLTLRLKFICGDYTAVHELWTLVHQQFRIDHFECGNSK